jgi:serine/threonine protein kinase
MLRNRNLYCPVVVDFGCSRVVDEDTGVAGTIYPPNEINEIDEENEYSAFAAEIYAVGATAAAVLVGVDDFQAICSSGLNYPKKMVKIWDMAQKQGTSQRFIQLLQDMMYPDPLQRPSLYTIFSHPCIEEARQKLEQSSESYIYGCTKVQEDVAALLHIGPMFEVALSSSNVLYR